MFMQVLTSARDAVLGSLPHVKEQAERDVEADDLGLPGAGGGEPP
jgi:hypothetical protein